ncbi:hypothetical protein KMW28_12850 [Flammeovirga yaeyamensis]|uniref:Lipoprotein n=1 Tax=Flammeovirga yaeyamensis TaxID=367791 RepID=A0AAX1MZ41_9BACT|nr:hypothetical protein [Flammeovirga yaeyamensis]MBB3695942.1 hypothetical protein [Flammeovirga yaeyamensis]NMF34630.1 hypothetical protein [Flammeovirga yaeyamensis]QWG00541.1 hypothetical protein KMW28_12850 [Flammeovirga yaeyamensis]
MKNIFLCLLILCIYSCKPLNNSHIDYQSIFDKPQKKHNFLVPYLDTDSTYWMVDRYTMEKKVSLGDIPMYINGIIPELGWTSVCNSYNSGRDGEFIFLLVYDKNGNKVDFLSVSLCSEIDGTSKYFLGTKEDNGKYKEAIFDIKTQKRLTPWFYKKYRGVSYSNITYTGNEHYFVKKRDQTPYNEKISFYSFNSNTPINIYNDSSIWYTSLDYVDHFIKDGQATFEFSEIQKDTEDFRSDKQTIIKRYKNNKYQHSFVVNYKGECIVCKDNQIGTKKTIVSSPWDSTYITIKTNSYHNLDSFYTPKSYLINNNGEVIFESVLKENGTIIYQLNNLFEENILKYDTFYIPKGEQPELKEYFNRIIDLEGNVYRENEYEFDDIISHLEKDKFSIMFPFNKETYRLLNKDEHLLEYYDKKLNRIENILPGYIFVYPSTIGGMTKASIFDEEKQEKIYFLIDTLGNEIIPKDHNQGQGMMSGRAFENAFGYVVRSDNGRTWYNFKGEQITPTSALIPEPYYYKNYHEQTSHFLDLNQYVRNIKDNQGIFKLMTTKSGEAYRLRYYMELRDGKAFHYKSDSILTEVDNKFEPFKAW